MKHLGMVKDYQLYRNSEGFIEAYKPKGNIVAGHNSADLSRIVTQFTEIHQFSEWIYQKTVRKSPPRTIKSKLNRP